MKQELTLDDARLAARIAGTLERAAADADPSWESRVEQVIAQAAIPPLAASVAFMVALPGDWLMKAADEGIHAKPASSAVDGQMLEEIDWLLSIEEAARERR